MVAVENIEASEVEFERLTEAHLDELLGIEKKSFPKPWPRSHFVKELRNHLSRSFVAVKNDNGKKKVVAYIVFWIVFEDAHILNLAVAPEERERGLAARLLEFSLQYMREAGALYVYLEVRPSNLAARALYEKFGFIEEFVREKYYGDEDATVMSLNL